MSKLEFQKQLYYLLDCLEASIRSEDYMSAKQNTRYINTLLYEEFKSRRIPNA